jgi:methyl-accepting chemotaxis protein
MQLRDIKIGKRLGFGFGVLIGISVLLCVIGLMNVRDIDNKADEIAKLTLEKTIRVESMMSRLQEMMDNNKKVKLAFLVFCLVSIGIGITLSVILTKSITYPIKGSVWAANRMAGGDLTLEFKNTRKDEFGEEMEGVKEMVRKWRILIQGVKDAALSISSASHELSASAEHMSKSSGDQAGRVTQVATATDEMSQTVGEIAHNTQSIATSAEDTVKVAKEGEIIVDRSVREVREIAQRVDESAQSIRTLGERSTQIGEIINVINDIADQTNLLALNAAIEAARAGEQGRGFAVVADEVRKLAERTANSTSEIGNMISAIQSDVEKSVTLMNDVTKKVEAGVDLSGRAGESLHVIVKSVDGLLEMVRQIASATEEMSATSMEISSDIVQIASSSRETSASSEQTARASVEMSRLSSDLEAMVNQFTV